MQNTDTTNVIDTVEARVEIVGVEYKEVNMEILQLENQRQIGRSLHQLPTCLLKNRS